MELAEPKVESADDLPVPPMKEAFWDRTPRLVICRNIFLLNEWPIMPFTNCLPLWNLFDQLFGVLGMPHKRCNNTQHVGIIVRKCPFEIL